MNPDDSEPQPSSNINPQEDVIRVNDHMETRRTKMGKEWDSQREARIKQIVDLQEKLFQETNESLGEEGWKFLGIVLARLLRISTATSQELRDEFGSEIPLATKYEEEPAVFGEMDNPIPYSGKIYLAAETLLKRLSPDLNLHITQTPDGASQNNPRLDLLGKNAWETEIPAGQGSTIVTTENFREANFRTVLPYIYVSYNSHDAEEAPWDNPGRSNTSISIEVHPSIWQ